MSWELGDHVFQPESSAYLPGLVADGNHFVPQSFDSLKQRGGGFVSHWVPGTIMVPAGYCWQLLLGMHTLWWWLVCWARSLSFCVVGNVFFRHPKLKWKHVTSLVVWYKMFFGRRTHVGSWPVQLMISHDFPLAVLFLGGSWVSWMWSCRCGISAHSWDVALMVSCVVCQHRSPVMLIAL